MKPQCRLLSETHLLVRITLGLALLWLPETASAIVWNATDPSYSAVNTNGLTDNYGQWTNASVIFNATNSTRGTTTYLKNGWFLSARHVVQNGGDYGSLAPTSSITIDIYGQIYTADQFVDFGSADVVLVHVGGYTSGNLTTLTGVEKRQVAGPGNGLAQIGGFGIWGQYGSTITNSISFHRAFNTPSVSGAFLNIDANQNSRLINDGYVLGTQLGGDSGGPMWESNSVSDQSLDLYDWSLTGVTQTGGGTDLGAAGGSYGFLQAYASTIWSTVYPHAVLNWNAASGSTTTATDGSGVWNATNMNWTDGTNYAFNGPERTEQAIFGSNNGAAGTVTLGSSVSVDQIIFNAAGSGNYTIAGSSGNSLVLLPYSRITTNVNATIGAAITGGSPGSLHGFNDSMFSIPKLTKDGSATLTLTGTTTLDGGVGFVARAGTTIIDSGGVFNSGNYTSVGVYDGESATLTVKGTGIYNGAGQDFNLADLGGTGMLNVQDSAALNVGQLYVGKGWTRTTSNGTQPYSVAGTGTVNQTGGIVTASNFVALGSSNSGSVGTYNLSGGTLQAGSIQRGSGQGYFNFNGGTLKATAASTTFMQGLTAATVNAGGGTINNAGFAITIGQALGGAGGFTFADTGAAAATTLTGANTYSGATTISGGTLQLGNGGTTGSLSTSSAITNNANFAINRSNVATQGIDFTGAPITGTGSFTQAGSGTTTLRAANAYTGATAVNRGVLALDFSASGAPASNIVSGSSALSMGGGTLGLTGKASTTNSQTFNGITVAGGGNAIVATSGASGTLNLTTGAITRTIANLGTLDITLPSSGAVSASSVPGMNNGVVVDAGGNWGNFMTVNGGQTWAGYSGGAITAFNTYTTNAFGDSTTHTDQTSSQSKAGGDTGDIRFNVDGVNLTLTSGLNVDAGGILVTPNAASTGVTIAGSTIGAGGGGARLGIFNYGKLTISSAINNSGNGVAYAGTGTTTLTGANSYTGTTVIDSGMLQVGNGGTTGSLSTSSGITNNGTLIINRSNAVTQGTDFSAAAISGIGSFIQAGSGTTTLNAANTFSGSVTVNGGTLYASIANAANNRVFSYVSGITVNSGGTLRASANALFGWDGTQEHPITVNSGGTLTANGGLTSDVGVGLVTLNGGTLATLAGGATDWGSWRFDGATDKLLVTADSTASAQNVKFGNANAAIEVASGKTLNFTGTIMDTTSGGISYLNKTGAGTLVLSGANTHSGGTTINAGTLSIGADNNLGASNSPVTINGGTLKTTAFIANSHPITIGSAGGTINVSTTGQYYFNGPNQLTGSGPLAVTGNGTLTANTGNLRLAQSNTYSGPLTVKEGGILECEAPGAISSGATIFVANQGEVAVNSGVNLPNAITVTGSSNSVLSFENGNTGVISGAIALNSGANLTVGLRNWYDYGVTASGTISGVISGSGGLTVINGTGSGGTLTLTAYNTFSGGTTVQGGTLNLKAGGANGTIRGTLTINPGATVQLNATDALGYNDSSSPVTQINIDGGILNNNVSGNNSASASWTLTGGTMSSTGGGAFHIGFNATNSITSNASATQSTISGNVVLRQNKTLTINVADGAAATDLLISGGISDNAFGEGAAAITKTGAGTMVLAGANAYTGTTTVNAGTLLLSGSGSTGTGTTTVGNSAMLGGDGTVQGDLVVQSGGTVAPGLSPGILNANGNAGFNGDAALSIELGGTVKGQDLLAAGGTTTLSGSNQLQLAFLGEADPADLITSGTYTILSSGSLSGTFGTVTDLGVYDDGGGVTYSGTSVDLVLTKNLLAGDANLDGTTNGLDLNTLGGSWLGSGDWEGGDFNGDGVVNGLDLNILGGEWLAVASSGESSGGGGSGGVSAIPEPGSVAFLVLGGAALISRRRRAKGQT